MSDGGVARGISGRGVARLAVELTLICAGALLALAFDEWREQRELDNRAGAMLEQIAAEFRTNHERISAVVDYHREMADVMNELARQLADDGQWNFPPEGYGGVQVPTLLTASVEAATMAQVVPRFPPDVIREISEVTTQIRKYERDAQNYGLATLQTDFANGTRYLRLLNFWLESMARSEVELLESIDTALASIEAVR
ncbi:MAG: hypothetical protein AAGE01_24790 [Pseudomonadota bacterium]